LARLKAMIADFTPDMVAYMDKMIGNVTAQLDRLGLREKTLIIVMGDNGSKAAFSYTLEDGSVFIGAKGQSKVNGLQVPLILSYPGSIAAGTSYNGLINLTDLLPDPLRACHGHSTYRTKKRSMALAFGRK